MSDNILWVIFKWIVLVVGIFDGLLMCSLPFLVLYLERKDRKR